MDLTAAYMRRQLWLQRNQAVAVINAYAEALNPDRERRMVGSAGDAPQARPRPSRGQRISGDAMLQKLTGGL